LTVQPGDVIRCTEHFTWDGSEDFVNIWHYKHAGASPLTDAEVMTGLASEIDGTLGFLIEDQSELLVMGLIEFYNLTQDLPMGSLPHPENTDGALATEPLPTQCAGLCTFRTADKRSVGRRYLPGFTEADSSDGGEVSVGTLANLAAYAAALIGGTTISGATFECGHWRKTYETFSKWVLPIVDTLYRTQRRRVKGVGR